MLLPHFPGYMNTPEDQPQWGGLSAFRRASFGPSLSPQDPGSSSAARSPADGVGSEPGTGGVRTRR
jgi:hypothetical protein